jgi:hypothetical protein
LGRGLLGLLIDCWVRVSVSTETLIRITEGHAPGNVYEEVRREFADVELIALSIGTAAGRVTRSGNDKHQSRNNGFAASRLRCRAARYRVPLVDLSAQAHGRPLMA